MIRVIVIAENVKDLAGAGVVANRIADSFSGAVVYCQDLTPENNTKLEIMHKRQFPEETAVRIFPEVERLQMSESLVKSPPVNFDAQFIENSKMFEKLLREAAEESGVKHNISENLSAMQSSPVNHPTHYNSGKIEVIDFIEDQKLGFNIGNAVKYLSRWGKKQNAENDLSQDLEKAVWYINREIQKLK